MSKIKNNKSTLAIRLLSLLLLMVMLQGLLARPAQAAPSGQRLRALAGNFLIGYASINDFDTLPDTVTYQNTAKAEFNFLTPENAMKFASIHPGQNTYNFAPADKHVAFAQANNIKVHGHTLLWHDAVPAWVANGTWTSATLTNVINNHIDTVMAHYKGKIYAWDVVNEAFNSDGSYRTTTSVWYNTIGKTFIEKAFQRARAADPAAKLIYNDFSVETINSKSNAMYNMVADFKRRGIPINGVGFQMHLSSNGLDYQGFADNMARFAALGVEIYITEMDVRFTTPLTTTDLNNQATIYKNVLTRCRAQPACKGLQAWGFTDKYSWIPSFIPGQGGALIFDNNYNAKPAYFALQTVLAGNPGPTATPVVKTATPVVRTATPGGAGNCSPVNATITAPFVKDGAGTFCWKSNNLGAYINSWNLTSLKVNGVNFTNLWAAPASLPAKIGGYWYVSYASSLAWGHFEAK